MLSGELMEDEDSKVQSRDEVQLVGHAWHRSSNENQSIQTEIDFKLCQFATITDILNQLPYLIRHTQNLT